MIMELDENMLTYLHNQYAGILDADQLEQHIRDHIDLAPSEDLVRYVSHFIHPPARILDVGSGFGSFVLTARNKGFDALGMEIMPVEVAFAKKRLGIMRPNENVDEVYHGGDALTLPFPDASFDAVSLWNVLEHVKDYRHALEEAHRVLRPGGYGFIVCPNYLAFRSEAHYHVFWPSLIPKTLGATYLRLRKRNPTFFIENIHYCTNWGVLSKLKALQMEFEEIAVKKIDHPDLINNSKARSLIQGAEKILGRNTMKIGAAALLAIARANPFKNSITLVVRKRPPSTGGE